MPLPTEPHQLTYFDFPGRAEPTRIIFTAIGLDFEDVRLERDEYREKKKQGLYPTGVPVLKVGDIEYTQSIAQLRYAGTLAREAEGAISKVYPAEPKKALLMDQALDIMQDLFAKFLSDPDLDKRVKLRQEFLAGTGASFLKQLVAVLKVYEGPFVGGSDLSIADLMLSMSLVATMQSGMFDGVPKDFLKAYPEIEAMHKAVGEHPVVVEYYKKREA